jgi:ribonuclease HI
MRYYTDGSSTIGIKSAYCVTNEVGTVLKLQQTLPVAGIPEFTNNEEEYRGVIAALELCSASDQVLTDSLLVVNQVRGLYKIKKPHLKPLCNKVKELLILKNANLVWIPREENLAGKVFSK